MSDDELKQALIDVWDALIPNGNNGDAVIGWDGYVELERVVAVIDPARLHGHETA